MLPVPNLRGSKASKDKNSDHAISTKGNVAERKCAIEEVPVSDNMAYEVIEGGQSKEITQILNEEFVELSEDQEQGHINADVDGMKEAGQLLGSVGSNEKRKRGRPPKKVTKDPEVSQQNVDRGVGATDIALEEVVLPVVAGLKAPKVDGSVPNKENLRDVNPTKKDKLQSKKVVQTLTENHGKDLSKRRHQTTGINIDPSNQDLEGSSVGILAEANGRDRILNLSDNQPLSMWLEAPQAADTTDAEHGIELVPLIKNKSQNDQCLPFQKSSPLWKTIEAMEVFRQLPQKPHFQPLGSIKDSSRQGLAIALMVEFAAVAEKIPTLQLDGHKSIIEDYLETLGKLENNGFDVKVLRDRLSSLLSFADELEQLRDKAKKNTDEINHIIEEDVKIDKRIEEIDKEIRLLQEKRALNLQTKEKCNSTIDSLEQTADKINNSLRNMQLKFEFMVAAPWQSA